MRTRRSVLVSVGGLITLTGCSQQSSQPSEDSDGEGATGDFAVEQFQVEGERPDEYEAEFISGSSPEEVADELTPEVSYQISGASGAVETEVRYNYSDATIPEDEPLDETVEADTHEGNGGYAQSPSMPDSLVSEILQNPKNLAVRFRATDMESEVTETEEYELNFADSYVEQIHREAFVASQLEISSATPTKINADNGLVELEYESDHKKDELAFDTELSTIFGVYVEAIAQTRIPYELSLRINDSNGEIYDADISNELQKRYLNGEITHAQMQDRILLEKLT